MGVKITEFLPLKEIDVKDLNGKIIAIDASLFLYQFITTIRQPDGRPLMDSKGRVTSHLSGLFHRSVNLMQKGLKLVYVYDGKPPELKKLEQERRKETKEKAQAQYKVAVEKEDIESMRKYASRTSKLTQEMVDESKELVKALGLPIVQAPSEAEAQASHMVKKGDCYAVATQDSDVFMFGATRLIRNLSMLGKRKKTKALTYTSVKPELVSMSETLNALQMDQEQFIALCMLIGTDYNLGGIKGIGPKKAQKLVLEHDKDFDKLFSEVKWDEHFSYPWTDVYYQIKKIPVADDYELGWQDVDRDAVMRIMVKEYEFNEERIDSTISKLITEKTNQKSIFDF